MKHVITLILAFLVFTAFTESSIEGKPSAVKGVMDLSKWDFNSGLTAELSGEWEFFWGTFIYTENDYQNAIRTGYFTMPGQWNGYRTAAGNLKGSGYGAFVLKIKLPAGHQPLALAFGEVKSSYDIIADWKSLGGVGCVGISAEQSIPEWRTAVFPLEPSSGDLILVQNVSNFNYYKGGSQRSPVIGTVQSVSSAKESRRFIEIFLFGSIFIIALYQLILHASRRSERSTLFFSFFCFLITVYLVCTGEILILNILPGISWKILVASIYLTLYTSPYFFLRYIEEMFPEESSLLFRRVTSILLLLLCIAVLVLPALYYSSTIYIFYGIVVITAIGAIRIVVLAMHRQRDGALPLLAGMSVLCAAMLNDMLYYQEVFNTGNATPAGVFILILTHGFAVSRRSIKTRRQQDNSARDGVISQERIKQIEWAVGYIQKNYTEAISREGLAAKINMHPDNFGRIFKQHTGNKIGEMINSLRIESARRDLAGGDKTVLEIAMKSGFGNLRTFNRVFREITGISPVEYRKQKKNTDNI